MSFVAIMAAEPDGRLAKSQTFATEADAIAHVAREGTRHPGAFVIARPVEPFAHWRIDMAAKTIAIDPPPIASPPPESEIIQAIRALAAEIDAGTTGATARIDELLGVKRS